LVNSDPSKEPKLPHLDTEGRARMVDVSRKTETQRVARGRGRIRLTEEVMRRLLEGDLPKGEALGVARIAAIQAAKDTARLIPLCHPLPLARIDVDFVPCDEAVLEVRTEVSCRGATGVEMEALTAAAVACLTVYDMCKGLEKGLTIGPIELVEKTGGQGGDWRRSEGAGALPQEGAAS
jgi:cyclic pyranopterin phosphate synthase